MMYYKLKDESFAVVNDYFDLEDKEETIIHLTNDKVEEVNLFRDEEKHYLGRVDNVEIRLSDKFGIRLNAIIFDHGLKSFFNAEINLESNDINIFT